MHIQLLMKSLTIFANVLSGNAVLTTDVAIGRTLQACGHAQLQSPSKLSSGSRRAELMVFCTAMHAISRKGETATSKVQLMAQPQAIPLQ
jgi:hypothetical protein